MAGNIATILICGFFGLLAVAIIGSMGVVGIFIVAGAGLLILICFGDFRSTRTTTISGHTTLRRDD